MAIKDSYPEAFNDDRATSPGDDLDVRLEILDVPDKCTTARLMWEDQFALVKGYERILFVLAAAFVVILLAALATLLFSPSTAVAISGGAAAIASGGATLFVGKQRSDARRRLDKYTAARNKHCANT